MPSFTVSAELPAPAQKIWEAIKDAPVIIPKIAPHAVASIEDVDGTKHAVGAVRKTTLVNPPGAFVTEKLTALDNANLSATSEEIEGGHLKQGFSKWVTVSKFTAISDSLTKWESTVDYEGANEAAIAIAKEKMPLMMTGVAGYVNKQ